MWTEIYYRKTVTKVVAADKDMVRRNQNLGNNSKDAMFDLKSGFRQSEDKRNLRT